MECGDLCRIELQKRLVPANLSYFFRNNLGNRHRQQTDRLFRQTETPVGQTETPVSQQTDQNRLQYAVYQLSRLLFSKTTTLIAVKSIVSLFRS